MFAFVVSLQHSRALLVPVAFLIGLLSASLGGSTGAHAADAGRPKTCLVLSGGAPAARRLGVSTGGALLSGRR